MVEVIFKNPYSKIGFITEAGLAKRQTAGSYLQTMEEIGLLEGINFGKERLYINKSLIRILSS